MYIPVSLGRIHTEREKERERERKRDGCMVGQSLSGRRARKVKELIEGIWKGWMERRGQRKRTWYVLQQVLSTSVSRLRTTDSVEWIWPHSAHECAHGHERARWWACACVTCCFWFKWTHLVSLMPDHEPFFFYLLSWSPVHFRSFCSSPPLSLLAAEFLSLSGGNFSMWPSQEVMGCSSIF